MADAWLAGREFGHEADTHSRRNHRQNPVLALTAIGAFDLYAEASAKLVDVIAVFAVDAVEVGLALDVGKVERVANRGGNLS